METLKNILGDDAEDKIKNVMSSLSSSDGGAGGSVDTDSINQLMQMKSIIENVTNNKNDPRRNLLMSLRPYMRDGRKRSLESAVKLLGLTNITKLFGR